MIGIQTIYVHFTSPIPSIEMLIDIVNNTYHIIMYTCIERNIYLNKIENPDEDTI